MLPSYLIWIGFWSTALWIIGMLRGKLLCHTWAKLVFFPGLVVEAVLRAATCLVIAAPILGLHPLRPDEPFLKTGPSRIRYFGPALGVVLRLLALFVALYAALGQVPEFLESGFALPDPNRGFGLDEFRRFARSLGDLPADLALGEPLHLLGLYTLTGVFLAMGLAPRQFLGALLAWATFALCLRATDWLGFKLGWFSRGRFIRWFYGEEFWATFSLLVCVCVFALGILVLGRVIEGAVLGKKPRSGS